MSETSSSLVCDLVPGGHQTNTLTSYSTKCHSHKCTLSLHLNFVTVVVVWSMAAASASAATNSFGYSISTLTKLRTQINTQQFDLMSLDYLPVAVLTCDYPAHDTENVWANRCDALHCRDHTNKCEMHRSSPSASQCQCWRRCDS